MVALVLAAFVIVGPLLSLLLWSLAERWTYPAAWPQRLGLRYWSRMLTGDFLDPLKMSLLIATIVTANATQKLRPASCSPRIAPIASSSLSATNAVGRWVC